ncbi:MAG: phage Gp37/Gp68 family protein [Proteobacteria bacterium]|nr:phage Gp37/Gp68 family protein [Pseudomonadota bacterium]
MSSNSGIEWTEATWNPTTGCSKISLGCKNCYAERMTRRLQATGHPNYVKGFQLAVHESSLIIPFKWKSSRLIFVNSMSDLFHEDVPGEFVHKVFTAMNIANWHTYQILTKRSERLLAMDVDLSWNKHIWMGVSVENTNFIHRIDQLRQTGAELKFISIEPMLGPLKKIDLSGIDWVIVGGESGPGARPMKSVWVEDVRDQCLEAGVPFFFKQWGGVNKKSTGRVLEGRVWSQMPVSAIN